MDINKTYVSGIMCNTCKTELPAMLVREHLDKDNIKNVCGKCEMHEMLELAKHI